MTKEKICECCGQTLYTRSSLNKGSARVLSQIFKFVDQKGINVFHPTKELVDKGFLDFNQRTNLVHLSNHGMVAPYKKEAGNWVITRKAGRWMKGEAFEKIAVVNKATKHTEYYEGEKVKYGDIINNSDQYWYQPDFVIEEGRIIRENEFARPLAEGKLF